MKSRKRNITMVAVLMFVCAAVALNWSYNNRWGNPDAEMVSAEDEAMLNANAELNIITFSYKKVEVPVVPPVITPPVDDPVTPPVDEVPAA